MSQKTYCDLCEEVIENKQDQRYLSIIKIDEHEKDIPVMPEKEICVICKEKVTAFLGSWK